MKKVQDCFFYSGVQELSKSLLFQFSLYTNHQTDLSFYEKWK